MNCGHCGNPLIPGNPVCPTCGQTNIINASQQVNGGVVAQQPVQQVVQQVVQQPIAQVAPVSAPEMVSPTPASPVVENIEVPEYNVEMPALNQVDANIAAPTLEVQNEQLTVGMSDISAAADEGIYEEVVKTENERRLEEESNTVGSAENSQKQGVNFEIPTGDGVVVDVNMPTDGSAPVLEGETETVGKIEKLDESKMAKFTRKTLHIKGAKQVSLPKAILIGLVLCVVSSLLVREIYPKYVYSGKRTVQQETKITFVNDGKNNKTKAGKYIFKIPEQYTYDKVEGGLVVYEKSGKWRMYFRGVKGDFEKMANAKTSIEKTLINKQIAVNSIKETKINDKQYITISTTSNMTTRMVLITEAKDKQLMFVEIVTPENVIDPSLSKIADDIIQNADSDEKENEVEKIKIQDVFDLLVTTAEYYNINKK